MHMVIKKLLKSCRKDSDKHTVKMGRLWHERYEMAITKT